MNHLDKAKSALEYVSSYPVREAKDVALVAIANALVAIAEGRGTCVMTGDIADEIEREIAEKYIELPVDADGIPICVGEDMVRTNDRLQPEVVRVIGVSGGSVFFKHEGRVKQNVAHNLHHVKPRTL